MAQSSPADLKKPSEAFGDAEALMFQVRQARRYTLATLDQDGPTVPPGRRSECCEAASSEVDEGACDALLSQGRAEPVYDVSLADSAQVEPHSCACQFRASIRAQLNLGDSCPIERLRQQRGGGHDIPFYGCAPEVDQGSDSNVHDAVGLLPQGKRDLEDGPEFSAGLHGPQACMPVESVQVAIVSMRREDLLQAPCFLKTSGQGSLAFLVRLMIKRDLQQRAHNVMNFSQRVSC